MGLWRWKGGLWTGWGSQLQLGATTGGRQEVEEEQEDLGGWARGQPEAGQKNCRLMGGAG